MEKTIPGIKDIYTVTDKGIIYITKNGIKTKLNTYVNKKGYEQCHVYRLDGSMLTTTVHRLVAMAFIPNPENKPQVNHKDAIKLNNYDYNLEWSTQSENMAHAVKNGLYSKPVDVYCYTMSYKLVKHFSTLKEAYEWISLTQGIIEHNAKSSISKCLKGTNYRKQAYGYYWSYIVLHD